MKNKLLLIFLLVKSLVLHSQNKPAKITLTVNDLNIQQIIPLIESQTSYKFYFLNHWLDNKVHTYNFNKTNLNEVLDRLFKDSSINYYIIDNERKIVLTKGLYIHKSTYDIVENVNNKKLKTNTPPPIIIAPNKVNEEFIIIGKESDIHEDNYSVSGYIKHSLTGKPIEGVTIFEKTQNTFATSDKNGFYKISLPYGINKVETSFVGFEKEVNSIILYSDGNLNFELFEKNEHLKEVTVDGTLNNNVKEAVTGITQIKVQDIKTIPQVLGERDILKIATTLPGISSAGEGAEGVNVRGGKVDQNLFLLDQGTLYNPTHFLGLFSAINPFTTKDLKIYKGAVPAEYGGRLSAVFDLKTKDASTDKLKGEASIGPVTGNVSLEIPIIKNKAGVILGARSTYSNWLLKAIDNKQLKNSSISFSDAIVKYNHTINKNNNLKLTGYYSNDSFSIASDTLNTYQNIVGSINWQHRFNDKNNGNLILTHSAYSFDIDYDSNGNKNFKLNYKVNESGLKLKMKYTMSKKHSFDYGIESKLYQISPGNINPKGQSSIVTPLNIPKEKALESSLFLSDKFTVNKKLTISAGIRFLNYLALGANTQRIYQNNTPKTPSSLVENRTYSNNEVMKSYQGLGYRLSARYLLGNDYSIKASYNKSFQFIHRLSNNTTASPLDTWRLSDTNIRPQEGNQISLGLFKNINTNDYELSLETYYKNYKNILDYKTGANLLLNNTIETEVLQGPGKSYGVEFLVKKNVGKFNGWLGYTFSRSFIKLDSNFPQERVNNGVFFPSNYDRPHDLSAVFNYKLTKRFSLSGNFSYQTGRPVTYPNGKYTYQGVEYVTYSNRNQYRIPDYYRLDIGLNIEGNHKIKKFAHSFWNISIYNVLGRNNPYSIYFETVNGNVQGYKSSIFSTPIPTITYNFKF